MHQHRDGDGERHGSRRPHGDASRFTDDAHGAVAEGDGPDEQVDNGTGTGWLRANLLMAAPNNHLLSELRSHLGESSFTEAWGTGRRH